MTVRQPLYVVLLGAPGAGKGTQAGHLAERFGIPHVSSGDLFREHLRKETKLGKLARSYMDKGELVPDDVTISMVIDRLGQADCTSGAILDGFPRTLTQAQVFDGLLGEQDRRISIAPYIRVSEEILLQRLAGRWTCEQCQAVYHELFSPPQVAGVCDRCGGRLVQRADDTLETQKKRIDVYMAQTRPLIDYYRAAGVLIEIDGAPGVAEVGNELVTAVAGVGC